MSSSNWASRTPGFAVTNECSVPPLLHPSHKESDSPRHMCDRLTISDGSFCLVSPHGFAPSPRTDRLEITYHGNEMKLLQRDPHFLLPLVPEAWRSQRKQ